MRNPLIHNPLIRSLRTGPARPITRQIFAFALVGVVNTLTYYGFYLLLLTRLPYLAAHMVASVLSMVGSFFLNARFTYRTRPTLRKFLLFPLTNVTNFSVTTAGVYVVVGVFHLGDRLAPLLASVVAIPVTFVVSRMIMLPQGAPATATPASPHAEPPPGPPALPAPPVRPPAR